MVNKYPDNIESGCYAFVQTDDGTTKQVLVPSSIDTRAENHDLAPTIFYDHCLALNGPCGPGGGTTIDGKWIPGDSCAGYQKSSTWTESWPHDGLLERSGEDGSDGMRRAQRIITPQGKDAYDETQIRGKRNDIKNSISGMTLQGPFYWKGPKVKDSSMPSEKVDDDYQAIDGRLAGTGARYKTKEEEFLPGRLRISDSLGEEYTKDTVPAYWDSIYSMDPRDEYDGAAKQIYTLNESNCDNQWYDGLESDIIDNAVAGGIDPENIPLLSQMDGPSKNILMRMSGNRIFQRSRKPTIQETYPKINNTISPLSWGVREIDSEAEGNVITNSQWGALPGGSDMSNTILVNTEVLPAGNDISQSNLSVQQILDSWISPSDPNDFVAKTRCQRVGEGGQTEYDGTIVTNNQNFLGPTEFTSEGVPTNNEVDIPKCISTTKCRCRPIAGGDPSKCYVDTGYCGINQGIQECNRDESDTPLTNKTYKKWSVIDKDGNDLVIQNLVPSIT